jgi:hypothetical protein
MTRFVETTQPATPPPMPKPQYHQPKESTVNTDNPHRIPTLITGWAVIATVIGGLYGASHDPEHASWSAFAIVASIGVYLYNKVRKTVHDRRAGRVPVAP